MKIPLKRSASLEFEFTDSKGAPRSIIVPAVTVGRYRDALMLEVEAGDTESPEQVQSRLVRQCRILCAEDGKGESFVDELDPTQVSEVISALMAVYAGMDPQTLIEVQRAQKKTTLLALLRPQPTDSKSATG
jgi:hypothetical protein